MLALSRKPGDKTLIGGDITVTVVEVQGHRVRLAFDAPDDVRILPKELACWQDDFVDADPDSKPAWSTAVESGLELAQTGC
jgi:carbon storage regulator